MLSIQALCLNAAMKIMAKKRTDGPPDYVAEREATAKMSVVGIRGNIRLENVEFAGIFAEKLSGSKDNGKTVLYLHGGGFTGGSAAERRQITQHLVKKYGYTVIAPDYRLSPEEKWPCHLDDCHAFYDALLDVGMDPGKMYFLGESAGGGLCLSLALRLRDEGKPLPAAIAAFSPWTNQTGTLPSHTKNTATDLILEDNLFREEQFEAVFGRRPSFEELKDPLVSPFYGDYADLPPVFFSADDTEVLYDDSALLYERLKAEGHPVRLQVMHGLVHAWPILTFLPEARRILKETEHFFRQTNRE